MLSMLNVAGAEAAVSEVDREPPGPRRTASSLRSVPAEAFFAQRQEVCHASRMPLMIKSLPSHRRGRRAAIFFAVALMLSGFSHG